MNLNAWRLDGAAVRLDKLPDGTPVMSLHLGSSDGQGFHAAFPHDGEGPGAKATADILRGPANHLDPQTEEAR